VKIDMRDNSRSILETMNLTDPRSFSISPIDCRMVFLFLSRYDNCSDEIAVYTQDGDVIRIFPLPCEIRYPKMLMETKSGKYLISDGHHSSKYVLYLVDKDGQMIETLLQNNTNRPPSRLSLGPIAIAADSHGLVYASSYYGEVLLFNEDISRSRILLPNKENTAMGHLLYDEHTDRLLMHYGLKNTLAAYSIKR